MSGLPERKGSYNLLVLPDDSEIMALCDTITNQLVQPEDGQDAVHAILVYKV